MSMRRPLSEEQVHAYADLIRPLKQAFDTLPDHVVITDMEGAIIYANPAVEAHTGYSIDEIMGKNPGDMWGGHMPKEFFEQMWHAIKHEKKPYVGEVKNVRKDGTEYWQELHISPILDGDGNIEFFIGIEPNITDRKMREEFHRDFLSIISNHALSPATGVRWTLEWLLENASLSEEDKKKLASVQQQNLRTIDLVRDLAFLSRNGRGHPRSASLDVVSLVANIVRNAERDHSDLAYAFHSDVESYHLNVNPSLLHHIVSAFVRNATHYNIPHGAVTVTLSKSDESIVIACTDKGIGISAEDQSRLFVAPFRGSAASIRYPEGSGVDLYLSAMIADHFRWNLSCSSEEGKGTTFSLSIPVTNRS